MTITTLIENHTERKGLIAEHGLALLIDTGPLKILFDTGQSGLFIQNARMLGIDVESIDLVILSHGHYDHTGGLKAFLEINKRAKVFCKKEILTAKYNSAHLFIGTLPDWDSIQERIVFIDDTTKLGEDTFILTDIPILSPTDTHFENLLIKKDNVYLKDEMADELFLAIRYEGKINILTACSHRGITNICEKAKNFFGLPLNLVLGGFHLKRSSKEQFQFITEYLRNAAPTTIGTCHCTGIDAYCKLEEELPDKLFYNYTGRNIFF